MKMLTFKDLVERNTISKQAEKLSQLIYTCINQVDDSLSYKDLATAVSKIVIDHYGEHNYRPFINAIKQELS